MKRKGAFTGFVAALLSVHALSTNIASSALPEWMGLLKEPTVAWGLFIVTGVTSVALSVIDKKSSLVPTRIVSGDVPHHPTDSIRRAEESKVLELITSAPTFLTIQGTPGIGKTLLAARVATLLQQNEDWHVILWMDASSRFRAEECLLRLGRALSINGMRRRDRQLEKVIDKLKVLNHHVLVVADGVGNFSTLRDIVPSGGMISVLATGSSTSGLPTPRTVVLGPLSHEHSARILREASHHNETWEDSLQLAAGLGGHVLAVMQAAAFLRTRRASIPSYFEQLGDVHVPLPRNFPVRSQEKDVLAAIQEGLDELTDRGSLADEPVPGILLNTLMVLGDCRVSFYLLARICRISREEVQRFLLRLENAGLTSSTEESSSGASRLAWRTLLVARGDILSDTLRNIVETIDGLTEKTSSREMITECVRVLRDLSQATHLQKRGAWLGVGSMALLKIVDKLYNAGDYELMFALSSSVANSNSNFGDLDFAKGQALRRIAHAYLAAGNSGGAVFLYEEAVAALAAEHGATASEVLEARIELGHALRSSNKADRAVAQYEQVLDTLKGTPHSALHTDALSGLGFAHLYAGRPRLAVQLLERVRLERIQELGQDSWLTLTAQTNLGRAYLEDGEPGKSEELLKDAHERRIRLLGEDNPQTLVTAFHLGRAWRALGRELDGRELIKEVATVRTETLGPGHPDTVSAYAELLE